MAKDKLLQPNIDNTNPVGYPNGQIRDNSGAGDGTPITRDNLSDAHEFFAKLMRLGAIDFNNLFDSEDNVYQYIDALREFASKNDFVLNVSTDLTNIQIPAKWDQMQDGEFLLCLASFDFTTETGVTGTFDAVPVVEPASFFGNDFLTGDYLRIVKTVAGADVIRLPDGDGFDEFAEDFGYLRAATQFQENAGLITAAGTTPLTNLTAFTDRVNGVASAGFLVSAIQNGIMAAADKIALDALVQSPFTERDTIVINPIAANSSFSTGHSLTGTPILSYTYIRCTVTHNLGGRTYTLGEIVPVSEQNDGENNDIRSVQNTIDATSIDTLMTDIKVFGSSVAPGVNGNIIIYANWELVVELFR